MKKLLIVMMIVALSGVSAFAMSFDTEKGKIDAYASVRGYAVYNNNVSDDKTDERNYSVLAIGVQPNSTFGLKWTQDDSFAHVEVGGDMSLRLLYGEYKFAGGDMGKLRFGQFASMTNTHGYYGRKLNNEDGLQGFGTLKQVRRPGVGYEISGFAISAFALDPNEKTAVTNLYNIDARYDYAQYIEVMPRIELTYTMPNMFRVGLSYVQTDVMVDQVPSANVTKPKNDQHYNIAAYHVMAAAYPKINDDMQIIASAFYAVNGGLYGMAQRANGYAYPAGMNAASAATSGFGYASLMPVLDSKDTEAKGKVKDTNTLGGALAFKFQTLEVGLGYQSSSNDTWGYDVNGMGAYANYGVKLGSNFTLTPEISYMDSGDKPGAKPAPGAAKAKAVKNSTVMQVGAHFRMDI
ncbi:MAG: hypothetical protein LBH05_02900 [Deferribacteraceae bacterium]|jgi:hypothetical protein|nr:hypothetical protein [Deferribacteraceae bacterium]